MEKSSTPCQKCGQLLQDIGGDILICANNACVALDHIIYVGYEKRSRPACSRCNQQLARMENGVYICENRSCPAHMQMIDLSPSRRKQKKSKERKPTVRVCSECGTDIQLLMSTTGCCTNDKCRLYEILYRF